MNLTSMLRQRAADEKPVRVALIGAGKFGSMFLSQVPTTPGMHLTGIGDLSVDRAKAACGNVGWPERQADAKSLDDAVATGGTFVTDDTMALIRDPRIDVVIDATGIPPVGIKHALAAIDNGKHIVMVNVEADVLAGPLLAQKARDAGVVYTMAYGDQPALIAEMVDWVRAIGFDVTCAGKGTKYIPGYHDINPDTVWGHYGLTAEQAAAGGMNPQMFASFMDGTKSAIEMAAVANACDLTPPADGLNFFPCGVDDLTTVLRPEADGGQIKQKGTVEVIACNERDGRNVFRDLRWGVYVTFEAPNEYAKRCMWEYGMKVDSTGKYGCMYKPYHLIGLELGISVANAALRGEATGETRYWRGDAVATAKKDLKPGDMLDGEGGFCVYGKLMPAAASLALGGLPIGLAHGFKLKNKVAKGTPLTWNDVEADESMEAVQIRREMERAFANR
ncbi:flagellar biosynthesis protein FlgA [Hwanghaeella grinnelliae]|uniref:Flagellar biosynthesis protein FlgA n=1 Tax=Hwanghaeella grinnelliae TaxID=2500179 RepID=A0A3S2VQ55_9PROT|nr:SAF domain-containing protein [Hwanghaeella grinnelliae]RVU36391.1 flagellar biosynthesis protein FlgA [Hwanghaeella grinnelliae]